MQRFVQRFGAAALIAALALVEYVVFLLQAGQARGRYGVPAPATTGHPVFERYLRVQQNTIEQLVIFLPALFICAHFASEAVASSPRESPTRSTIPSPTCSPT